MSNISKNIYNILANNGVSFWDSDTNACNVMIEGNIVAELGIAQTLSYREIIRHIPLSFRTEYVKNISVKASYTIPVQINNNMYWIEVHKLYESVDNDGHLHQIGSVRLLNGYKHIDNINALYADNSTQAFDTLLTSFDMMNRQAQLPDGIRLILHTLCRVIDMDEGGTLKWESNDRYEVKAYTKVNGLIHNNEGRKIRSKLIQYVCQMRKTFIFDSNNPIGKEWQAERAEIAKHKIRSMIIAPLVVGDKSTVGAMIIFSKRKQIFSSVDVQFANMIAARISVVIDNKITHDKLHEQLRIMCQACEAGKVITWVVNCKSETGEMSVYQNNEQLNTKFNIHKASDIVHKNDLARFYKAANTITKGETDSVNIRIRIKGLSDGIMGWRELRGVLIRDVDGKPDRIVGISRDINEEVLRVAEEKAERDFQNTIYNKMPVGIQFFNEKGELVFVNDTALEIYGIEGNKRNIMGRNILSHPNLNEQQLNEIKYAEKAQFVISYDFRNVNYKTSRTDTIDMNYRMSKLYKKNKFAGYIVAVADNTEMVRQAKQISIFQRYFLEIGKFAKMGICWFSDTKNGYVSEQWNINLGVKPDAPYMRNLSLLVRVNNEDLEVYGSLLGRIFVGDIDSFQYELRATHDDGMTHYIKVQFVRSDEVIIGISIDVTQAKENEKMLIDAKFRAEAADMLKSQFLDNMNHEIRTPLNAIVGFSDIIAQSTDSDELKLYANLVRTNNDLLLNAIGDIIDLSKITSGTMEYNYQEVSIDALVNEVYEEYNNVSHSKIEFVCTCAEKNIKSYCDAVQLKRILSNFVSNAFKFTVAGRVEIYFGVNGDELIFNVIDSGCGIPADKLEDIFKPYFKLDVFSTGTGLGLSICQGLAHDMGGRIEVFSTEGIGSHFRLYLPHLHTMHKPQIQPKPTNKIMLLSSNNEIIQFVSYALSEYDLLLEKEHIFMSLWLEKKPMLTIVDQQLFGDSIAVVVSSLHNYGIDHKVIVIANGGVAIDHDAIMQAGAEVIISMPISKDNFKTMIANYIGKQTE